MRVAAMPQAELPRCGWQASVMRLVGVCLLCLVGFFRPDAAIAQGFSNQCFQAPWRFGCPGYVPGSGYSGLQGAVEPPGRRCAAAPGSPGCEIYKPETGVSPLDTLNDQKRALRRYEREEGVVEPGRAERRDQRRRGLRDDDDEDQNAANPLRRDRDQRETGDPDPREASRDPQDRRLGPGGRELTERERIERDRAERDRDRDARDGKSRDGKSNASNTGRIDRTERVGGIPAPRNDFGRFDRNDRTGNRGANERRDPQDTRAWGDAR